MKKWLAFALFLFVLAAPLGSLAAGTEKSGYTLTPIQEMGGGVAPDSAFLLTTETDADQTDIQTRLSIDGEAAPHVTKKDATTFLVQPAHPLESGRLYTFRLTQPEGADLTWVFQTMFTFAVANVFPGDQTSGVPLRSGIEITFNYEDYEDISPYFQIEPQVEGTFERHKRTAVFVPKEPLAKKTLYTVTLKGDLKLKDTDYILGEDTIFRFETEDPDATVTETPEPKTTVRFSVFQAEFTPQEVPNLSMHLNTNEEKRVSLQTEVYQVASAEEYISLWKQFNDGCTWSTFHRNDKLIDTGSYSHVVSFQQTAAVNPDSFFNMYALKFPQKLPEGFYLVQTKSADSFSQMLIQITNTAGYYQNSKGSALLWLNDNKTRKPLAQAAVLEQTTGQTHTADKQGVVLLNRSSDDTSRHYFIITTADGKVSVMQGYAPEKRDDLFWSSLELDRPLYQPKDSVQFWGYVAEFGDTSADLETVKVRLSTARYYWYASQQPILQQTVQVQNNTFAGQMDLPYLDSGTYVLTVEAQGKTVCSEYLRVEEYIKPDYQLTLEADKTAVFTGETIHYTMQTAFFDGTPVSNLPLSYNIYAYPNLANETNTLAVNEQGVASLDYTVPETPESDRNGSVQLGVRATLPEGGEMSKSLRTRTFLSDIAFSAKCPYDTDKTRIEAQVNLVDLTRLNDGTAEGYYDYLGDAVAGKTVQGTIYENYYEQVETGTYYDYYNKVSRKTYRYVHRKKVVKTFTEQTDAAGKIAYPYSLRDKKDRWYSADLTIADGAGKQLTQSVYLRTKETPVPWYRQPDGDYYHLEQQDERESFQAGDEIDFLLKNNQEALKKGSFLFMAAQNGIRDYQVQNNSAFTYTFAEQDIPCAYVKGVWFDGVTYHSTYEKRLTFDFSTRSLDLTVQADRETYCPGDSCTLTVQAKRPDGAPAANAAVNLSLVDEALFALQDQETDILNNLYTVYIPSGLSGERYTHYFSAAVSDDLKVESENAAPSATPAPGGSRPSGGGGGGSVADAMQSLEQIRSDFKDTAAFRQIWLDENGSGTCTLRLPDNITTWRLTASAITPNRYAATVTLPVRVSLPFFINCSLGDTFLTGDTPQVGLSAYGEGLQKNESVTYTVWSKNDPQRRASGTALAYERLYLPLWTLAEGDDVLVIQASTPRGNSDSLEHPLHVVSTYYEAEKTVRAPLAAGMTFAHGEKGSTHLIFTDRSRGALLSDIYYLLYQRAGDRLEQRLSSQVAYQLIQIYGDDNMKKRAERYIKDQPEFKASEYQTANGGGLSLFTYSSCDLDYTAKLLPLVKDDIDKTKMVDYLYTQSGVKTENAAINAKALYGLAVYQEPILLYLDELSRVENLSPLDAVYCALAYLQVGGQAQAQALYDRVILPLTEEAAPYCRVNTGRDQADILETTALAACLASQLAAPQREGFYQYALHNYSEDYLVNIEKLMYVSSEIERRTTESGVVTYRLWGAEYTKTLENGACHSIELASGSMDALEILSVTGDMECISCFTAPMENEFPQSEDISIQRKFFLYGTDKETTVFHANDIIQVVVTVQYGEKAVNRSYEVTDLLPSGLKFLNNTSSLPQQPLDYNRICYGRIAGQKVQFYSSKYQRYDSYTYLARVQSPGTYTAAGTLVQSTAADGIMRLGAEQQITVLPE